MANVLLASWRPGSLKQYMTYITQWKAYCKKEGVDSINPPLLEGAKFLTSLHERGVGHSALRTACSALSAELSPMGHVTFGKQPMIKRLMKGFFNKNPSLPKYTCTYDANIVLQHVRTYDHGDLGQLTKKLATLLSLVASTRSQTLHLIDIDYIMKSDTTMEVYIPSITKGTTVRTHIEPLKLDKFPEPDLCVYKCLEDYLSSTEALRKGAKNLFISYVTPHKAVSVSTIRRWLKDTLRESGIDITVFSAHSTRSSSTSKAEARGVSLQQIAKAAGWSNGRTFATHYKKPIEPSYSSVILTQ